MGNLNLLHRPLRNGKWEVTYEEWPEEAYPPYANGPGYIISIDIANYAISRHGNRRLRLFKMEDVSMGMWVEQFNSSMRAVRYSHNWKFWGSGVVSRRLTGQSGADKFVMKIPNNKVGLVIGKGGETIKNMQANTGARIQVIPLHLPPGDTSTERTLQIDGTSEQIETAKQLVNEVISECKEFKREVFKKVQLELDQFGLLIYNANVKQLVDVPGHEYFSYLGQKTQMEAANQAKIDVAEAKKKGEIGAKEREGQTSQNAAKINAETKVIMTQRQGEAQKEKIRVKTEVELFKNRKEAELAEYKAELATKNAGWSQASQLAEVESTKAVTLREAELQTEVEKKKVLTQTEKLRAELLSKAAVEYETKVQEANWELYKKQKAAEAILYEKQKAAEAEKASADAKFYACQQASNSVLYAKKKEAEGITALAQAEGFYLNTLLKQLGGNYTALRDYMMINKDIYQEIARINAQAVNGLQPKITVWSNGKGGEDGSNGAMKDVAGVYSMLPPLLKTVHEQTGMLPPTWLGTLSDVTP
nr:flotillin-like protein 3 [Quercus suber]POF15407.1 flotillin-like protein 3 [Quercus suber]